MRDAFGPIDPEAAKILASLNPNAPILVMVRAGDYAKACQEMQGGPAELTPGQAAARFGRSPKYWRAKAEAGEIPGAYKDPETERWYLPNQACRDFLAGKAQQHEEQRATKPRRLVRRGPRKRRAP